MLKKYIVSALLFADGQVTCDTAAYTVMVVLVSTTAHHQILQRCEPKYRQRMTAK